VSATAAKKPNSTAVSRCDVSCSSRTSVIVRTFATGCSGSSARIAPTADGAIRALDPEQPVANVRTMTEVRDEQLTSPRLTAVLFGFFAAIALTLATVGIYSVLAYIVRGRSREIGIRSALGARTGDVLRLVVREGMTPAVIGIVAGVIAARVAALGIERLVFGVSASDPLTLTGVALTLGLVALLASLVPAYRASRLDPATVLRD